MRAQAKDQKRKRPEFLPSDHFLRMKKGRWGASALPSGWLPFSPRASTAPMVTMRDHDCHLSNDKPGFLLSIYRSVQIFAWLRGSSTTHQPSSEKGSSEPVLGDFGVTGSWSSCVWGSSCWGRGVNGTCDGGCGCSSSTCNSIVTVVGEVVI